MGQVTNIILNQYDFYQVCFLNAEGMAGFQFQYDTKYFAYINSTEQKNLPLLFFDFASNIFKVKNSLEKPEKAF